MTPRLAHALVGGALALVATVLSAGPASAHGAPTSPLSRSAACGAEGTGEGSGQDAGACRAALDRSPQLADEWDNVRVAGVRGRNREVIPDGELCSGGRREFSGLDLPRPDWPATVLTAGAAYRFGYRGTIPHTGTFRLYATHAGYAPDRPLTWSDLDPEPFLTVTDPPLVDGTYAFDGTLPAGRTGRQLIYTIWQNSSTPDTYYSCSDVDFAAATGSVATAGGAGADGAAAADAAKGPGTPGPPAENTVVSHGIGVPVAVVGGVVLMTATAAGGLALGRRARRRRDS